MKKLFSAEKMSTHCHWVGVIDWRLRNFHGYLTGRGSTYNAYLVKGEGGYVLIDTVKAGFEDEFMSRIETVCDPREIRVVVSNHAEMDHTGALPQLLNRFSPDCRILASRNGAKAIQAHFSLDREIEVIKSGQTAEILGKEFVFLETPMIHWPDSMLTYFVEDKILFSNDAFGMHLASVERWYDEFDSALAYEEALRYYANIITPYSQIVAKFLDKFDSLALDIDAIAPDHGLCWRGEGVEFILGHYKRWASVEKRRSRKVAVVFDTMWESTELMARHIAQGV
ncbi:MAG: FprA family A-type flavoprotein, partial [Bradymonadia bacterium]